MYLFTLIYLFLPVRINAMVNQEFESIDEILVSFPNEELCILHLERVRWNGKVASPFDPFSKVYDCKGNRYRCRNTSKYFNVKTGTIFHNSKIPLQQWFIAIWVVSNNKGISSVALGQKLNLTQKTSWYMLQRIKKYLLTDTTAIVVAKKEPVIDTDKINDDEPHNKLQMSQWLNLFKK
jgi:hypothetical protein